jgi:hypothetical protein
MFDLSPWDTFGRVICLQISFSILVNFETGVPDRTVSVLQNGKLCQIYPGYIWKTVISCFDPLIF